MVMSGLSLALFVKKSLKAEKNRNTVLINVLQLSTGKAKETKKVQYVKSVRRSLKVQIIGMQNTVVEPVGTKGTHQLRNLA
jgi:hypothetical protein